VALMRNRSNAITLTRGRVAQWGSMFGSAALVAGILGFIWQGSLSEIVIVTFAVGIAGIALWVVLAPQDFTGFITGRRVRYGTVTFFSTLLLTGIVALAYVLLQRNAITLDMTQNNRYTLSSESLRVLQRVTRDIQITGFYTSRALTLREIDDQFFRLYETATDGRIRRQYIDPEENPAQADAFGVYEDGQVFISYLNDDGTVELNSLSRVPRGARQERDMTEAISRLLIAGTIKVYFAQGNGERDPLDPTNEGLSGVNAGIQESGLVTAPIDITGLASINGDIPNDAAAIIFARPLRDLTADEIAVIDRYLQRGGSLFVMADMLYTDDAFMRENGTFNQYLWENFGIRALDQVVVDAASSGTTALDVISDSVFTENDIGARLNTEPGTVTMFRVVRALEVNLDAAPPNIANGRVIMSSAASYGETDLEMLGATNSYAYDEGEDTPGPLTTVVWAFNQQSQAKIVLVGDSDFATNGLVLSPAGNGVLFTDSLAWLSGLSEEIQFAPQAFAASLPLIFVSQQQLDLITFVTIILLPGVTLVTGLAIWTRRVRR
jgi:ABC-type uncharacterized transport system involved in gliding motility auxiliary subunit